MKKCIMAILPILLFQFQGIEARLAPAPNTQVIPFKARPLPLNSVRLLGGPLKNSQDLNGKYLLELEPDRMMAYLRQAAGLAPKAKGLGGWDGPDRQLTGHIAGHYLSGVSMMYAATGDVRYKERADYLVRELKEVQDKHGDGYLGALKDRQGVDGKLWVNLYVPTAASWDAMGVKLEMTTDMPEGQTASLKVTPKASKNFTLALRRPAWAGTGFTVKVNGNAIATVFGIRMIRADAQR